MFSRPSFCCSCGEKVERIEWHVWTSRRFCELCQTEYQFEEWFPRLLGACCVLIGMSGIGGFLAGPEATRDLVHSPVEMAIERGRRLPLRSPERESPDPASSRPVAAADRDRTKMPETGEADAGPPRPPEVVVGEYFCGAETKKGGPCSRKVRGPVRCWQRKGREPVVPQENLAVGTEN